MKKHLYTLALLLTLSAAQAQTPDLLLNWAKALNNTQAYGGSLQGNGIAVALKKNKYPSEPSRDYYLVFKVEAVHDIEFKDKKWDITKLKNYKTGSGSGLPFSASLTELMNSIV